MQILPTETKSVHIKTYVEPSVAQAISDYQIEHNLESVSAAARALILSGISAEQRGQPVKRVDQ